MGCCGWLWDDLDSMVVYVVCFSGLFFFFVGVVLGLGLGLDEERVVVFFGFL